MEGRGGGGRVQNDKTKKCGSQFIIMVSFQKFEDLNSFSLLMQWQAETFLKRTENYGLATLPGRVNTLKFVK